MGERVKLGKRRGEKAQDDKPEASLSVVSLWIYVLLSIPIVMYTNKKEVMGVKLSVKDH